MKYAFYCCLMLFSFSSWAIEIDLPWGGKISVKGTDWDVLETKALKVKSFSFIHKKVPELHGILLNGMIQTEAACDGNLKKQTFKRWTVCELEIKNGKDLSYQIYFQQKVGQGYQNYVINFNFSPKRREEYVKILKDLASGLESK